MATTSMRIRLLLLLATLLGTSALGFLVHFSLAPTESLLLEIKEINYKRDSDDPQKVELVLELTNSSSNTIQIWGVSRTDCGYRSVSQTPPCLLAPKDSEHLSVRLAISNPYEDVEVPLVIFASDDHLTRTYSVRVAGEVERVPTLAPRLGYVVPQ